VAPHVQDAATAKKLAFSREVNARCVTLDGDDFNPSGTLTGGSRNKGGSLLAKLHELTAAEAQLAEASTALREAESALRAMAAVANEHKQ
jgi:structural maintenance of chromosome 2